MPHKKEARKLYARKIRNSKPYKRNSLGWMTEDQIQKYKAKKMRIYRKRKPEVIKAIQQKIYIKDRDNLTDAYIKKIIQNMTGASYKIIPDEFVELQRAQIKLTRTLKERHENDSTSKND